MPPQYGYLFGSKQYEREKGIPNYLPYTSTCKTAESAPAEDCGLLAGCPFSD